MHAKPNSRNYLKTDFHFALVYHRIDRAVMDLNVVPAQRTPFYMFVSCADFKMSSIFSVECFRCFHRITCPFIDPLNSSSIIALAELIINMKKIPIESDKKSVVKIYTIHVTKVWSKVPIPLFCFVRIVAVALVLIYRFLKSIKRVVCVCLLCVHCPL